METPPLTSVTLGFLFTFYALLVESQPQNEPASPLFFKTLPPLPSPPPPPLAPPPPPFPLRSSPPPPSPRSQSPPPPPRTRRRSLPPSGHVTRRRKPPPPSPPSRPSRRKMNTGKKIGLLFAGIAAILQIGVVGYLVFKRKQLSKVKDRYENCPS